MNNTFNSIALNFLTSIHLSKNNEFKNEVTSFELAMFNMDLAHLGYTLDKKVMTELTALSIEELNEIKDSTLAILSEMVGDNKKHVPLFKSFPYNIPDENEYFIKRLVGFIDQIGFSEKDDVVLSCGHVINSALFNVEEFGACPICQGIDESMQEEMELPKLSQVTKLKVLSVAKDSDVFTLFKKLVNSKTNLSEDLKSVISDVFAEKGAAIKGLLPRKIEIKENAAFVSSLLADVKGGKEYIKSYNKTATDVLRFAVACSGGDVSLADKTKFKLSRSQKNLVMSLLDSIKSPEEDLKRFTNEWLILSKIIHIGAFKKKYPSAFKAIDMLRNNKKEIKTFESSVEEFVKLIKLTKNQRTKDQYTYQLAQLLSDRAGVFARRMDFLLRNSSSHTQRFIVDEFVKVMGDASNNVLLGLKKLMDEREHLSCRVFMPKGSALKMKRGSAPEGKVSREVLTLLSAAISKEVSGRFLEKEKFENVYIDPAIEKILVPFAMRSNSSGAPSLTRGSRIAIDENADVVRFFIHWHNVSDPDYDRGRRVDLDLSAVIYNNNFEYVDRIYYGGYGDRTDAFYSGDITDAPGKNGAFEAIDIHIDKMRSRGRYVVMCLNSYTHQPFADFEASAGIMERSSVGGGQAFEPKTVKNRFALNGQNKNGIPLIIDLETKEMIWVDIQNNSLNHRVNNVVNNSFSITESVKVFAEFDKYKMNLKELIDLHSPRFGTVHYEKDPEVEYDLEIDMDFARDLPEVVANWL